MSFHIKWVHATSAAEGCCRTIRLQWRVCTNHCKKSDMDLQPQHYACSKTMLSFFFFFKALYEAVYLTFPPLSQKNHQPLSYGSSTMAPPQKNAFWIIECPEEEGCAHFKLKAKQIGAELLRRIISVCLWMSSRDGRSVPPHCVSVCFSNVSLWLSVGKFLGFWILMG